LLFREGHGVWEALYLELALARVAKGRMVASGKAKNLSTELVVGEKTLYVGLDAYHVSKYVFIF
jgi:hypothetical protein